MRPRRLTARPRAALATLAAGGLLVPLVGLAPPAVAAVDITVTACPADYVPDAGFLDAPPPLAGASAVERETVLAINCLAVQGVALGVTAEQFGRPAALNRGQAALFLSRVALLGGIELDGTSAGFTDLGGQSAEAVAAIDGLADLGVINGYADGTFRPAVTLTRGQMAALLSRLVAEVTGEPLPAGTDAFTDDEPDDAAINAVFAAGIANGTGAGTFAPGGPVSRQQMALFLARTLQVLEIAPAAVQLRDALGTATITELSAALAAGEVTSVELVSAYLDRVARLDAQGPALNAVRLVDPAALELAAAADAARAAGDDSPLLGIPVMVKDNIDVDGLPTTAGSVALASSVPVGDAPVVEAMQEAGLIVIGKLNLTEFANFTTSGMPSGYSSLGGQVLNPYDLSQTPSGSSAGSGVAAAAGLAAGTVGTETSGSILSPARANSVVGVKPTVGLVSSTGIIPISSTQDTAGPMTRSVADAALMLTAMAVDQAPAVGGATLTDLVFEDALTDTALQGTRLGVIPSEDPVYAAALATLQAQGAELVTIAAPTSTGASILNYEFKRDLNAYFATRTPTSAPVRSLADVIAYNLANPGIALKFGQTILEASQALVLDDPATRAAYESDRALGLSSSRSSIDGLLADNDLDAIVSNAATTGVAARAGYPTVAVPAGYAPANRRPVSLNFTGTAYSEERLLQLAYDFEQAADVLQSPEQINPTAFRCAFGPAPSCGP